jgi:hypothetical protein
MRLLVWTVLELDLDPCPALETEFFTSTLALIWKMIWRNISFGSYTYSVQTMGFLPIFNPYVG